MSPLLVWNQHVAGIQASVQHPEGVCVAKCQRDVAGQAERGRYAERAADDTMGQRRACHIPERPAVFPGCGGNPDQERYEAGRLTADSCSRLRLGPRRGVARAVRAS